MDRKSLNGLCAHVVSGPRSMGRGARVAFGRVSRHARRYGSDVSTRVSELLAACAAAATPRARLCMTVEPLEGRRLYSSVTLANGVLTLVGDPSSSNSLGVDLSGGTITSHANGQFLNADLGSVQSISITGGSGADFVYVNPGISAPAVINTGDGNDTIYSGPTADTITCGNGNDFLLSSGNITLGDGNNTVWTGNAPSHIQAGNGNNLLVGGAGNDTLIAGSGSNTLIGGGGSNVLQGGANTSFPSQSSSDTVIVGGATTTPVTTTTTTTTASGGASVFSSSAAPSGQNVYDPLIASNGGVELGVKFQSNVSGSISGVRFYKGTQNTGTHTGELWTSTGQLLATATFSNETASGWQQVNFSNAVSISANTTYIVSYHTNSASISYDAGTQASGFSNGTVKLLPNGADGGNSVYQYGSNTAFPGTYNGQSANYWVDVVFSTAAGVTSTPITPASPPAATPPVSPPPPPPPAPPSTGGAGSPNPVINVIGSRTGQVEHSIFVDALSSSLGDGNQLNATYKWDFGDPGSSYNVLPGWNAGHIYDRAGNYTITLTITNDLGKTSTATTQVSIGNNTRTTIYVDNNGNDNNSGLAPWQAISSPARIQQLLAQYNNSNVTVLFARGETFNFQGSIDISGNDEVVGAYGNGAAPVLMKVPGWGYGVVSVEATATQAVVENLTFDSVYTAPINNAPEIVATGVYAGGSNLTVRNNTFLNVEDAVDCVRGPTGVLIQNNSCPMLTGLRAYFVWMNGSEGVVLGNSVANSTREHIMRSSYTSSYDWLIAGNNFTNDVNPADPGEGAKTTINLRAGDHFFISDNTLSDAALSFGPDDALGADATVSWIKLDGNTINNAQTDLHGSVQHAMISNNLINMEYYPDITLQTSDDMNRPMNDVTVAYNTGVLQSDRGSFLQIIGNSPGGVLTIKNNLFAAPNLATTVDFATSVIVTAPDLGAASLFSHNIWAQPSVRSQTFNAINYVAAAGVYTNAGFMTLAQWNALPNVQDDHAVQTWVSGSNLQAPIDGQMAGAVLPAPLS